MLGGTQVDPHEAARLRCTLLDGVRADRGDQSLRLGPPQRRAVLNVLLLNAGRVQGVDTLLHAVWGETPPAKASGALQVHVSALRRELEPGRAPRERSGLIRSVDHGYLVTAEEIEVDVAAFQQRLTAADRARATGDLATATASLRAALELFRTTALLGVPGPFAANQREMLAEQRLGAYEDLVELDMLNRPTDLLDHDLTELIAGHPHRERLLALNMRLLQHNGRRADALAAYAEARRVLVTDLGIEPGAELRRLHQQILAGDPVGPVDAPRVVLAPRPVGRSAAAGGLPRQPYLFGRDGVLAELTEALTEPVGATMPTVVLHGLAGVGKTATAVWAAGLLAERFPGGRFLLAADAEEEDRVAVLTRAQRSGRCLLIVDDVTEISQARLALPDNPECAVLITSRHRGRRLPFARRIALPPLPAAAGRELFRRVVGAARADREPAAVDRLVAGAAGVPTVLLSLAEHLTRRPTWALTDYADNLAGRPGGGWSLTLHLRVLFERCYTELDSLQAKVFRAAAVHPAGSVASSSIAAMTGLPVRRAELLLEELVDRSLLETFAPGWYTFQPLVRRYAVERTLEVESAQDVRATLHRLSTHLAGGPTQRLGVGADLAQDLAELQRILDRPRPRPTLTPLSPVGDGAA
jgi:DNA-binding SARP family transcriptional activator